MDRELCSIPLNQPSDVLSGGSIAYKKYCMLRRQSERRVLSKVQQKNSGVAAGVYANENSAVLYYSEDYYLGNNCTKDEE